MFCPNCGKGIEDGAKFCPYCGKAVSQADKASNGMPENRVTAKVESKNSDKVRKGIHIKYTIIAAIVAVVLIFLIGKPSGGASFNTDASTYFDLAPDEVQQLIDDAGLEHDDLISGDYDGYYFDAYTDEYITISVHSDSIDGVILSADGEYSFGDLSIGDSFEGIGSSKELINDGWTHDYGIEGRDLWMKDDKYLDIHYEDNVITQINCSVILDEFETSSDEYSDEYIEETTSLDESTIDTASINDTSEQSANMQDYIFPDSYILS